MSEGDQKHRVELSRLELYLAQQNWKEADDETRSLMCRIVGRETVPHLTPDAIRSFPCEVLHSLDLAWAASSQARFGFRVQRKLWLACGGTGAILDFEKMERNGKAALADAERKFVRRVNWHDARVWTGHASSLPIGYLPYSCLMCSYGLGLFGLVASALAWRLCDCGTNA